LFNNPGWCEIITLDKVISTFPFTGAMSTMRRSLVEMRTQVAFWGTEKCILQSNTWFFGPQTASRSVQPFCTAHPCAQNTDTHTHTRTKTHKQTRRPRYVRHLGPQLCTACRQWRLKIDAWCILNLLKTIVTSH